MVMELRQLEYFVAVAEEASFTKAAARVHVAQPGVSAQIRRLERELGQDLLDRSGRSVRLTGAGAAVLEHARAALDAVAGARLAVDELAGLVRGRVRIGMVTACPSLDLVEVLAGFHREHPGVQISLSEDNSDRLIEAVLDGRLDLAWVGAAGPRPAGISAQVIIDDALLAAVRHGDRLAGRSRVPLGQLRERAMVTMPSGTGIRAALDTACAAAGFRPRITFEATALHMVAKLAAEGLGVGILPESVAETYRADVSVVPIVRPRPRSRIELAWRTEGPSSPAARALTDHARAVLELALRHRAK
jgi:DNA-binding transcriptional LysR family regulator